MSNTPFEVKCSILAEIHSKAFWIDELKDFLEYNDIGLPLAYAEFLGLSKASEKGKEFIEESWKELCKKFGVDQNKEYQVIDDIIDDYGMEEE